MPVSQQQSQCSVESSRWQVQSSEKLVPKTKSCGMVRTVEELQSAATDVLCDEMAEVGRCCLRLTG